MKKNNSTRFTSLHRVLHGIIGGLMLVLFLTGFLRMYWMNKNKIVSIIESKTQNTPLSQDQMVDIAKTIREPMWQWHQYAAYVIVVAFLLRIIYMFVKGIKFPNPLVKNQSMKEKAQGWIYLVFYVFLTVSMVSGFYMKWIDGDWNKTMETVHKWAIYWFPLFILVHFAGILMGELTDKKGIVSKMIGGDPKQ